MHMQVVFELKLERITVGVTDSYGLRKLSNNKLVQF